MPWRLGGLARTIPRTRAKTPSRQEERKGFGMTTRLPIIGVVIAAFVFLADQAAKYIVRIPFDLRERKNIEIFNNFDLTWVENWGVSLGIFGNPQCSSFGMTPDAAIACDHTRWLLVALTAAISIGVLIWMFREKNRQDVLALGLILGGALGNIVDRVRFGYVVDYADLHFGDFRPFLIFNVADAAITIGVVILLLRALLVREQPKVPEKVNSDA
jgi:signal peptidase II